MFLVTRPFRAVADTFWCALLGLKAEYGFGSHLLSCGKKCFAVGAPLMVESQFARRKRKKTNLFKLFWHIPFRC